MRLVVEVNGDELRPQHVELGPDQAHWIGLDEGEGRGGRVFKSKHALLRGEFISAECFQWQQLTKYFTAPQMITSSTIYRVSGRWQLINGT